MDWGLMPMVHHTVSFCTDLSPQSTDKVAIFQVLLLVHSQVCPPSFHFLLKI